MTTKSTAPYIDAFDDMRHELAHARVQHSPVNSLHEAIAVIREEYLELEAEVFKKRPEPAHVRAEARQLGAMVARLLEDCYPEYYVLTKKHTP